LKETTAGDKITEQLGWHIDRTTTIERLGWFFPTESALPSSGFLDMAITEPLKSSLPKKLFEPLAESGSGI
jgi:hypothetical protein